MTDPIIPNEPGCLPIVRFISGSGGNHPGHDRHRPRRDRRDARPPAGRVHHVRPGTPAHNRPLTEIFGNRDYEGSSHFFFDVGNGNLLAFFDFPGLDLGPYAEVLGGINHIAISVTREKWDYLRGKLDAAGVPYQEASGTSIYFRDPDGVRLELLADPLGEMYGTKVL